MLAPLVHSRSLRERPDLYSPDAVECLRGPWSALCWHVLHDVLRVLPWRRVCVQQCGVVPRAHIA